MSKPLPRKFLGNYHNSRYDTMYQNDKTIKILDIFWDGMAQVERAIAGDKSNA